MLFGGSKPKRKGGKTLRQRQRPRVEWTDEQYRSFAYRRMQGIVRAALEKLIRPGAVVNLYATLPQDIEYPPLFLLRSIQAQVTRELADLASHLRESGYRVDPPYILQKSSGRGTIQFKFHRLTPDTTQRRFEPK